MKNKQFSPFLRQIVSDRYAFFWEIPEGRFKIKDDCGKRLLPLNSGWRPEKVDENAPFLVCQGHKRRYYAPLRQNPVLHRTFCGIEDDAGIIEFASSHGFLGFTRWQRMRRQGSSTRMLVESLPRWRRELSEMKRLMHLWQLILNKRTSLLAALMSLEDDGLYISLAKRRDKIAGTDSDLVRKWQRRGEQPLKAALLYLSSSINSKIRSNVYPEALPAYKRSVYLMPEGLLSAMWLMFLWEVIGEVRPRRCPGCDSWFESRRSTRRTCSDRCRKKVSRLNVEKLTAE